MSTEALKCPKPLSGHSAWYEWCYITQNDVREGEQGKTERERGEGGRETEWGDRKEARESFVVKLPLRSASSR